MTDPLVEPAVKLRALEPIPNDYGPPHSFRGHNMVNCVYTMPPAELERLHFTPASFVPYMIANSAARHAIIEIYGNEYIYSMLPGASDLRNYLLLFAYHGSFLNNYTYKEIPYI